MTNVSQISNRLLFTGRDRDSDTGWYNYRNRYYNPGLGRFVQPDPIGIFGGDVNLYGYCLNSSLNFTDPNGLAVGEFNRYREMLGGAVAVGPLDAWDVGPGEIGSRAFLLSNTFAAMQPRLPCESERKYAQRRSRIANALRHVIWQAMLTQEFGAGKAKRIGNLHELGEESTYDSQVDQYHNALGRRLGETTSQLDDVFHGAIQLYKNGKLIYQHKGPQQMGTQDSSYHLQENRGRDNIPVLYH